MLTSILHWLLFLSLKQTEWQSQPISATRLLLSWLKSNQKYIVWKSPSFKISSWSFTVRPSNSCTALTQVDCESLYSFRLIITKIQFLPCLPDLSVMNDKVKGGKKTQTRERNRKRTRFSPHLQLGQIISRPGSLHLYKRDLFLTMQPLPWDRALQGRSYCYFQALRTI